MTSPFHDWALDYKARGFSPMPINPGTKVPGQGGKYNLKKWSAFCSAPASDWLIRKWMASHHDLGITLACGYGGLIAVDVDDERAYPAVRQVLGHIRPPAKLGQRGGTAFFFDPTGKIRSKNVRAAKENGEIGGTLVEFLGWGRQTVIPPTIHAKTSQPYRWKNATLIGVRPADLPVITQAMVDEIVTILKPMTYKSSSACSETEEAAIVVTEADLSERMRKRMQALADAAFRRQEDRVKEATRPGRSDALNAAVISVGKYVHHGFLAEADVRKRFLEASEANGLVEDNGEIDVKKVISRALAYSKKFGLPQLDKDN